jgi:hypothetical protein
LIVAYINLAWAWDAPTEAVQEILREFADKLPELFASLELGNAKEKGRA